ncbi:response regulator [Tahibacter amnicola]|uniref:Response regulator n=1 Tax=Tahibacter amnicola TaxID=2976241 RepID=A0ABY6BJT6_9GAMM|nr:response regulator [Tahibacter amnicola]UXI70125.1 response regulator [Tahibacter amnicola]
MTGKAKVIVIDDEMRIVAAIAAVLEGIYDVVATTDPFEVLRCVQTQPVHVVLADLRMPAYSGADLLREVRAQSPQTTRLLLSDFTDLAHAVRSISVGDVYRFVRKPWDSKELLSAIAQAVELAVAANPPGDTAGVSAGPSELPVDVLLVGVADSDHDLYACTVGSRYTLHRAGSVEAAARVMDRHPVGVVIVDMDAHASAFGDFLIRLRAQRPDIVTLVQASPQGARHLIALINQAQVFRYLAKPLRPTALTASVDAALLRHAQLARQAQRRRELMQPAAPGVSGAHESRGSLITQIHERARV